MPPSAIVDIWLTPCPPPAAYVICEQPLMIRMVTKLIALMKCLVLIKVELALVILGRDGEKVLRSMVLEMMKAIVQGCKVHWGDQEPVEGVHYKSLSISGARGEKVLLILPLNPILSHLIPPVYNSFYVPLHLILSHLLVPWVALTPHPHTRFSHIVFPYTSRCPCCVFFQIWVDLSNCRWQWKSLVSTRAPPTGTQWLTPCQEATMWFLPLASQVLVLHFSHATHTTRHWFQAGTCYWKNAGWPGTGLIIREGLL